MRHIAAIAIVVALTGGVAEARDKPPHCTFDRVTVGVTPCGADKPNAPPSNNPRPPGEPVYWSNGVQAERCSWRAITAQIPGEASPRTGRAAVCAD